MADDREALIRSRAYELWEAEGTPHGRHDDHWAQASREIAEAQEEAVTERPPVDASAALPDRPHSSADAVEPPVAPARRGRKAAAAGSAAPKGRRRKDG